MTSLTPGINNMSIPSRNMMALPPRVLLRKITKSFTMAGLSLRTDAVRALQSVLKQEDDVDEALDSILQAISRMLKDSTSGSSMSSGVVDLGTIERVVTDLTKNSDDRLKEALSVVDAYDSPRLCYDPVKKSFYFYCDRYVQKKKMTSNSGSSANSPGSSRSISSASHTGNNTAGALNTVTKPFHGNAFDKVTMFRERFQMVKQRVLRNPMFCRPSVGGGSSMNGSTHIQLTSIDSLLGARGTLVLLGMLTRREEGKYHLEDMNGSVEIDLSNVTIMDGLFTLGCIVVVEGTIAGKFYCCCCFLFCDILVLVVAYECLGFLDRSSFLFLNI